MKKLMSMAAVAVFAVVAVVGCKKESEQPAAGAGAEKATEARGATGTLKMDGSSTVYPIAEAVAEEFQGKNPEARVTVGVSGTGGGFKKFCAGETDISNASRPIKPVEVELCQKNGIEYIELPVAYDGIAVLVNPQNTWVDHLTTAELKKIWEPAAQGTIMKWSQVRAGWPDAELHLYGAGVDSGTYDYFTEAVVQKEHSSRGDYTSSEDDNVIVQGIANDKNALGFFGYAYYAENKDKLKVVPIDDGKADNGEGPIPPSPESVRNGTYQPLSRPIFIYVAKKSLERPIVSEYVKFMNQNAAKLVAEVGYIALPERAYTLAQQRADKRVTGSMLGGKGSQVGISIEDLLEKEAAPPTQTNTPAPAGQ